ncbi:phosphonate metabolism protein/1,5-bisphosphokinase (PRPP-forming) PhnN [Roseomonas marmotae]|uniref:Ribose 1,5-bisphosphate phosphokinase PhnN n=1 Tax=Roseomonas marmotae TaxID=2768161 RepID=A0ABS3KC06_9PROT|nr:phosphonate metabolism protein/1,5-bisphosphokinase (PRPP-forming) PhnN [Roseomonas marmotae]MBO1074507.1 phosphonate metabolism protein/1,5-bisphosphokinase (PRPP-forming) PhnN [Roseomonas marmotae]QTI78237.1 phosphonate metabolism protein/1,5-bisphosphokinase (PRPP-forming) PhnN [Roseomonas marmotae]
MPGWLVTVVGPSGAGKDTLLGAARAELKGDSRFVFARRAITRPAESSHHAGTEDHLPMSEAEFAAARDRGVFALHWQAHGLRYGVPRGIEADLDAGRVVIANLSRAVLAEAHARYRLRVILVTAPPAVLAQRLSGRGRETAEEIIERLSRSAELPPGLDVVRITNDSTPEEGAARLLQVLRAVAG